MTRGASGASRSQVERMSNDDKSEDRVGPFFTDDLPREADSLAAARRTGRLDSTLDVLISDGTGIVSTGDPGTVSTRGEGNSDPQVPLAPFDENGESNADVQGGIATERPVSGSPAPRVAPSVGSTRGKSTARATGSLLGDNTATRREAVAPAHASPSAPSATGSSIVQTVLSFAVATGSFPNRTQFRIDHEHDRAAIDAAVQEGLLRPAGDCYVVTMKGLLGLDSDEAHAVAGHTFALVAILKSFYRRDPSGQRTPEETADALHSSPKDAAIALAILLEPSMLAGHTFNPKNGLWSQFVLAEKVLDIDIDRHAASPRDHLGGTTRREWAVDPALRSRMGLPRSLGMGRGLKIEREASEQERCLRVDDYAAAVAHALDSVDGEACFAILGSWGRGKTYLVRCLKEQLANKTAPTSRTYEVIDFSAWRYPTTPETWIHLYECFANKVYDDSWYRAVPRAVRANLARFGVLPIVGSLVIGALALIPLTVWFGLAYSLITAVGVAGALTALGLYRAFNHPVATLQKRYLLPARHTEKLGMQATIGSDLRILMDGWFGDRIPWIRTWVLYLLGIACFAVVLSRLLLHRHVDHSWVVVSVSAVVAIGIGFISWSTWCGRGVDRVLLVVDDVDRCAPAQTVAVVDALKLLVEDPLLGKRIQVVVVAEEDALRWAIGEKYKGFIEHDASRKATDKRNRVVEEYMQKLFVAHLRLPALRDDELREALERFLGADAGHSIGMLEARPSRSDAGAGSKAIKSDADTGPLARSFRVVERGESEISRYERDVEKVEDRATDQRRQMDAEERKLIGKRRKHLLQRPGRAALFTHDEAEAILAAVTPVEAQRLQIGTLRGLRSFLIRYQLARALLALREVEPQPHLLALGLADGEPTGDANVDEVLELVR